MRDSQEYVAQLASRITPTESLVGVFVSQDGPVATVDVADVRVQVKSVTTVPVLPSDPVRLERRGSQLVMLGPTVPRAATGRVTVAGSPATVEYPNGSGVTATLTVAKGVTTAVNDIVLLDWSSGGMIVAVITSPAVVTPPPPSSGPSTRRYTQDFTARDSGAYQSGYGWRTNEVWSSASNIGAWFYGSKIADTIPDDASIVSAKIYLPAPIRLLGARPFGRHTAASQPSGPVAITNTSTLAGTSGWVPIPTSHLDALKTAPGGLGFGLGGYNVWPGTQDDGASGTLRVVYDA